jgi:hypothetical protein
MGKVKVAFNRWDGGTLEEVRNGKHLVGFQEIGCHVIFNVKMDDGNFTRKVRLVTGGHTTVAPASITCSSVLLCKSMQLAFTVAGLNDLDMAACRRHVKCMPMCALPQEDLDGRRTRVWIGFGLCDG